VQAGTTDFQIIFVYDVSRWGRFQDADESAYYEYICRRAGIQVAYCAEQFENDGSPVSTIVKGVKRAMAGEYSRELSAKVFAGQCRLIELGFRQGGPAGYGLRRVLIDQSGSVKGQLSRGEHKSLQTDRVILQPGPDAEVAVVNQIYRWFVEDGLFESEIADRLNTKGTLTDLGRAWTRATVREVLSIERWGSAATRAAIEDVEGACAVMGELRCSDRGSHSRAVGRESQGERSRCFSMVLRGGRARKRSNAAASRSAIS
jgi:DNA invertase Pin-like site-specific DNA recombinase